jgi:signal-induced proliferation-associated 1 like protein 3
VPVPLPPVPVPLPPVPVPLPPVPVPVPPVPVLPPVPLPPVQLPLLQVCPEPHLFPHEPQLVVVVMSTQLPMQSFWLELPQLHEPPTQVVPPVQALPQVPQSAEFVSELQAPSEHLVPEVQVDEHVPSLLQTSPLEQVEQFAPQCWAFEATQEPPHDTNPLVQLQLPA